MELLLRFLIGGAVVSLFAVLGDVLRPKSFAGLFGAAPSVALATLGLTIQHEGASFASTETRSMLIGALAFMAYAGLCVRLLLHGRRPVIFVTVGGLFVWLGIALGLQALWLGYSP